MRRLLVVAIVSLGSVACSLLVSTSGYSDPNASSAEASVVDARDDVALQDAISEADGGADAALLGFGAPFCARRPGSFFCADFDGTTLLDGWTGEATNNGTLDRGESPRSTPLSFVSTTTASPGNRSEARLYFVGPALLAPKSLHLEFDVRLCATGGDAFHEFFKLQQVLGATSDSTLQSRAFEMQIGGTELSLVTEGDDESGTHYRNDFAANSPTLGQWHHFAIDVILTTTDLGSVRLLIDDVQVLEAANIRTLSAFMDRFMIIVGGYVEGDVPSCADAYDNVLMTTSN